MKYRLIVNLILIFAFSTVVSAQKNKDRNSYNYMRGVEAYENSLDESLEYFNKEIKDNPNNGYAYARIATINILHRNYSEALTTIDKAIKNIPKKDKPYKSLAYSIRSDIYYHLDEVEKAIKDITKAISIFPDIESYYKDRGDIYLETKEFDLATKDYQKIIDLNQGNVYAYFALGRVAYMQENYDDAIKRYDFAIKLDPKVADYYSNRAECYYKMGMFDKAIDDVIKALELDLDEKTYNLMNILADNAFVSLSTKLQREALRRPNDRALTYFLGNIYYDKGDYQNALKYFKMNLNIDLSYSTVMSIAHVFLQTGFYDKALEYANIGKSLIPDDEYYFHITSTIYNEMGEVEEALKSIDHLISIDSHDSFNYYLRGWIKDKSGDYDGAIEDYSTSILLNPNYAYLYFNRGDLLEIKGDRDRAKDDYKKVIELDTIPEKGSCSQFAYLALGDSTKAIEFMNKIIKENSEDFGVYYDAACLYAIMGDSETALRYLEDSLEKGFRRFAHIRRDRGLDNIRKLPQFNNLIEEYEQKLKSKIIEYSRLSDTNFVEEMYEIPFVYDGNSYRVKCEINELPLHFILDTGASITCISKVEANFMLKNQYLSPQDFIGKDLFMTATGEITDGAIVNIKNIKIGGLTLHNIRATVIEGQDVPLLLGLSVLQRLGNIEIDNENKLLKIKHLKKELTTKQ